MAKGHAMADCGVFLRQFPGCKPAWGRCEFTFDPDATNYDWLVCYDDLAPVRDERFSTRIEPLNCPPQHTMLITMEPSSIKIYGRDFLSQFGVVLTSQEPWAINSENTVYSQPALRWYYGVGSHSLRGWDQMWNYPPEEKTEDLSTVCSSKQQSSTLHACRFNFIQRMRELVPEMRVFGYGVEPINDKADAIDSFRYHLVVENHLAQHHWTEKLADAFLGLSLPLYVGCPNAADYFPPDSFIPLNISDLTGSAARIRQAIANNEFEKRLPAIREARRRVLECYNLFAVIANLIEQRHSTNAQRVPDALLLSRHAMRHHSIGTMIRYAIEKYRHRRRIRQLVRDMQTPHSPTRRLAG